VTIGLARYDTEASDWLGRSAPWGLRVENDVDVEQLVPILGRLGLITVEFPKFTDGRGYTVARRLRRAGYRGELRAIGDVLHDQISFMERCGFDAFALKAGKDLEKALEAFDELAPPYQTAVDSHPAAWRRHGDAGEADGA